MLLCRIFVNTILFLFLNYCLLTHSQWYDYTTKSKSNFAMFKVLMIYLYFLFCWKWFCYLNFYFLIISKVKLSPMDLILLFIFVWIICSIFFVCLIYLDFTCLHKLATIHGQSYQLYLFIASFSLLCWL